VKASKKSSGTRRSYLKSIETCSPHRRATIIPGRSDIQPEAGRSRCLTRTPASRSSRVTPRLISPSQTARFTSSITRRPGRWVSASATDCPRRRNRSGGSGRLTPAAGQIARSGAPSPPRWPAATGGCHRSMSPVHVMIVSVSLESPTRAQTRGTNPPISAV